MSRINLDDLKRLHDWARIKPVGSKEWLEFSGKMIDCFPSLYQTAKQMNAEQKAVFARMHDLEQMLQRAADLLTKEQLTQMAGLREVLERDIHSYAAAEIAKEMK